MEKLKNISPFLILLVFATIVIIELFPRAHPEGGIQLPLDRQEIQARSREILIALGIDRADLRADAKLRFNKGLLRQTQQTFGIQRSNYLLRDSVTGYFWDISWRKPEGVELVMSGGGSSQDASRQSERVLSLLKGEVYVNLDTRGKLLGLEREVPDSLQLPSLSQEEAEGRARAFLKQYVAAAELLSDTAAVQAEKRIEQPRRVDYEFTWETRSRVLKNAVQLKVSVAGDVVSKLETQEKVPDEFVRSDTESVVGIVIVVIYVLAIVGMVVVAFRRFRSFELGFRLATIIGIVTALMLDIELYLSAERLGWSILIALIVTPIFVGGALVLAWAVSESVTRETWKEKFITLDLISKGHGIHSRVGEGIVRGIALGVAALALWLLSVLVADSFVGMSTIHQDESTVQLFGVSSAALYALGHGLTVNAYKFTILILFVVSLLRRRVASPVGIIALGAIIMGFTGQGHVSPLLVGIVIDSFMAAVAVWAFYRYDALTSFLSLYTLSVVQAIASLYGAGHPSYAASGALTIGFFAILLLAGLLMLMRKREITDFDAITPAFARHITERHHMQQELEIARNVQMSFLPKANPKMLELDIASRCAPAAEVGGDYYDFVDLGEGQLGVAVGDVSGKGTQAAFFMTLTKGFLRALAQVSASPAAVLTHVNKLFYDNVERGVFVSMVYGVFDTRHYSLTVARAGHNPVIMHKTQALEVQVVNPMGIALGLDQGETFTKSIQEVSIPFQKGDLFVFYTDGFPEAMNKTMEEFGEDRLCRTVQKYAHGSAAEIMDGVFAEMKQFVGRAKQHDDMTIVVVKVV